MEIRELQQMQMSFDESHGFQVKFEREHDLTAQIMKDLVGLFGELGEFSNILKRVVIKQDQPNFSAPTLEQCRAALCEEMIDAFIYVVRISALLGADMEAEYLRKLEYNKVRYASLYREIDRS